MARKNTSTDTTLPDLPLPLCERPKVKDAAALVQTAAAEVGRAQARLQAAESALAEHRAKAAGALLDALEAGAPLPVDDGVLVAAVPVAKSQLDLARAAHQEAVKRHQATQAAARCDLAAEAREVAAELLAETVYHMRKAVLANDRTRALSQLCRDAELSTVPYDFQFQIPTQDRLEELIAARHEALNPTPPAPPKGRVLVRWLEGRTPYRTGEVCGLPEAEAQAYLKASLVELVEQSKVEPAASKKGAKS